jgi:membrane-bound lytic murein transglycosylase F
MFSQTNSKSFFVCTLIAALLCALFVLLLPGSASAAGFDTINRIKTSAELHVAMHGPDSTSRGQNKRLLQGLADSLGARLLVHQYTGYDALFRALSKGEVDLIGDPLATSRNLPSNLKFSLPVRHNDLWLVGNAFHSAGAAQTLGIQYQSDSWHQALTFRSAAPGIELKVLPSGWSRSKILHQVATGRLDASLAYAHELTEWDLDPIALRPQKQIRDQLAMAWVLRGEDRVFRSRVNDFVREYGLTRDLIFASQSDWPKIMERGRIRMVTYYRPDTYFAWEGRLLGFEFELAKAFAQHYGLALDVVLAHDATDLQQRLQSGDADFAAAFLSRDPETPNLIWSRPYLESSGRVISQAGRFKRLQPLDFHGRRFVMPSDSPYIEQVRDWQQAGIGVELELLDRQLGDLLTRVATGSADFMILDDYRFEFEQGWRKNIDGLIQVPVPVAHNWAVRANNPLLLKAIDDFWNQAYKGLGYGMAQQKYFGPSGSGTGQVFQRAFQAFGEHRSFSPYDELVRRYAGYYDFDWRLILAIISQESRFDPQAISRSGARGLMQVRDPASRQVGISELHDPRSGIHAGVKYLDWVRNQFEPELDIRDRTWFSLASYNGGIRYIREARQIAEQMGLDPRRWFGQVETALASMAQPQNDPAGRYAALDETQVIDYVRRIRASFESYVRLTELPDTPVANAISLGSLEDRRHAHAAGRTDGDQAASRTTLR